MNHCEACYDLGAECECDCHSKTPLVAIPIEAINKLFDLDKESD